MVRKLSSHYVLTPRGLSPGTRIDFDDRGMVLSVEPLEDTDSVAGLEFYSGLLVPGFTEIFLPPAGFGDASTTGCGEALATGSGGTFMAGPGGMLTADCDGAAAAGLDEGAAYAGKAATGDYATAKKHSLGTGFIGLPEPAAPYDSPSWATPAAGYFDPQSGGTAGIRLFAIDAAGRKTDPQMIEPGKRVITPGSVCAEAKSPQIPGAKLFRVTFHDITYPEGASPVPSGTTDIIATPGDGSSIQDYLLSFQDITLEALLTIATINNARAMGIARTAGSFEPGKYPGAVLIEGIDWERGKLTANSTFRRIL